MRKQLTEAQKAETPFTDLILEDANEELGVCHDVAMILERLRVRYKLSNREACCALRDYAQLLIARHMDAAQAETQARIKELEAKLR